MTPGLRLAIAAVLALILSNLIARILIRHAPHWGLHDEPNARSSHRTATPRAGGLGIVAGFMLMLPVALPEGILTGGAVLIVVIAALLLTSVGLADDLRGLGLAVRLFAQALAVALLAIALGLPAQWTLGSVVLAPALLLIGVWWINLFNFMDGIDGLAASQALFMLLAGIAIGFAPPVASSVAPSVAFWVAHAAAIVLAAAIVGFLMLNWAPARIFMGDCGSLFLGFAILAMAAYSVTYGDTTPWLWPILGAVFLTDATVTLIRRAVTGQNVTTAHRTHLYQRLGRRWQRHSQVALVYSAVNLFWLFPLALWAQSKPSAGPWLLGIACLPLIAVAWRCGAGLKEA